MTEPIEYVFSTPAMSAAFSTEAHMRGMLAFEAALARAEARAGIIPQEPANTIAASCKDAFIERAQSSYREFQQSGGRG